MVNQEEVSNKGVLERVRNTVKVTLSKDVSICQSLVCISIYDTKTFYISTNCCEEIKWKKKYKQLYDTMIKEKVKMPFYSLMLSIFIIIIWLTLIWQIN